MKWPPKKKTSVIQIQNKEEIDWKHLSFKVIKEHMK